MFPRVLRVILGTLLLAAVAAGVVKALRFRKNSVDAAAAARSRGDIRSFAGQLKEYETMNGFFPTTEQGLQVFVEKPSSSPEPARWRRLADGILIDEWKTPYIYRCPGVKHPDGYDLFSAGPDRKPDTPDDVWAEQVPEI